MFNKRALRAYEARPEKKKPIEKKDRLSLTFSFAALIVSSLALGAALVTVYYNVLKLNDEIRVVFERVPGFSFKNNELHAEEALSFVFINAGNRPAIISSVAIYLWESSTPIDENKKLEWDCKKNEGKTGKRILMLDFEPVIVRQNEIVRTEAGYGSAWAGQTRINNDEGVVRLPLPEWAISGGEYWLETCYLFQLATPSKSYAQGSARYSRSVGFTKAYNFSGDSWVDTTPYLIWESTELRFSR